MDIHWYRLSSYFVDFCHERKYVPQEAGPLFNSCGLCRFTKNHNPFNLNSHCYSLFCDVIVSNYSSLLNCQAASLLFRYWCPRRNASIKDCISCFSHILLYYTANTNNKCYRSGFCFWPLLQSVTATCLVAE